MMRLSAQPLYRLSRAEGRSQLRAASGERRAERGETRESEARRGRASQDEGERGETRESEARRGRARQDEGEREDGRCQGMSNTDEIG